MEDMSMRTGEIPEVTNTPVEEPEMPMDLATQIVEEYRKDPLKGSKVIDAMLAHPKGKQYPKQLEKLRKGLDESSASSQDTGPSVGRGTDNPLANPDMPGNLPGNLWSAAKVVVPIAMGIGATGLNLASKIPALADVAPVVTSGLDYLAGSTAGRMATGQNPVSAEAVSEAPLVMGGPLASQLAKAYPGLSGAALRSLLAVLGGSGGAQVAHAIRAGKPELAGPLETILGGATSGVGQVAGEVAGALQPTAAATKNLEDLVAAYPNLKGKISSALAGGELPGNLPPAIKTQLQRQMGASMDTPRLSVLEHLKTDPLAVQGDLRAQQGALDIEAALQTNNKMPSPDANLLEQLAKQTESGRVKLTVEASKKLRDAANQGLNGVGGRRAEMKANYNAITEPLKKDTTKLDAEKLIADIKALEEKYSSEISQAPSSPFAQRIAAVAAESGVPEQKVWNGVSFDVAVPAKPQLTAAQAEQIFRDMPPMGGTPKASFNRAARGIFLKFIQDNASKLTPQAQAAANSIPGTVKAYTEFSDNRKILESLLGKAKMNPEGAFGNTLVNPPDSSESIRQVLGYFKADPAFQKIASDLNASTGIPKILDTGFKSGDELLASAIDITQPDRANRAWETLKKITPNKKDLEIIGSKIHENMLYPGSKPGVTPEINLPAWLDKFNLTPEPMLRNIYGPNYDNARKFADLAGPYIKNSDVLQATPKGIEASARASMSSSRYAAGVLSAPAKAVVGSGMAAAGQTGLGLAFVFGPAILGKLILSDGKAAFGLLQGLAKALQAQSGALEKTNGR